MTMVMAISCMDVCMYGLNGCYCIKYEIVVAAREMKERHFCWNKNHGVSHIFIFLAWSSYYFNKKR